MPVEELKTLAEFHAVINGDKPVLIDFWATWCGPCRQISPLLEEISNTLKDTGIKFYKVDVDKGSDISEEVGIRAMPTFQLWKNGAKISDLVGANAPKLKALVELAQKEIQSEEHKEQTTSPTTMQSEEPKEQTTAPTALPSDSDDV